MENDLSWDDSSAQIYIYISRFTYLTYVMINNIEYSSLSIANCVCYTPRLWSTVCETCDQTHTAFVRFICCCVFCCSFAHRTEPQKKKIKRLVGMNAMNVVLFTASADWEYLYEEQTRASNTSYECSWLFVVSPILIVYLYDWAQQIKKQVRFWSLTTKSDASSTKMQ